jgi:dienelactone hydrolase
MKRTPALLLLAVAGMFISSCAVKTYPRPVTAKEKMDTNLAYGIDTAGAKLVAEVNAGPRYDLSRQRATIDYNYYLDPKFKADPRLFYPAPSSPPAVEVVAKLTEDDKVEITLLKWPSLYQPMNPAFAPVYEGYPETHTAYGVYMKSKSGNKGAIVISHGWTGGEITKSYKLEKMEDFAEIGYDSVLIQQPYHGLRAPADSEFSGELFFSGEVARTNEAFCQTVTDVRSMVMWLRPNYKVVGIKGGSLGGITTLLTAAVDPTIDFAIAWVPPSSLGDMPKDSPLVPFIIKGLEESGLDQQKLDEVMYLSSPANFQPAIPKDDLLIFAGMGDNFVPPYMPAKVWQAWDQPPIFWFAGGHVKNFELKQSMEIQKEFLVKHLANKVDATALN